MGEKPRKRVKAGGAGVIRTTISLPSDLKVKMDSVEENVNWSGLAAEAFARKLGEIEAQASGDQRHRAISRLRKSLRETRSKVDADYQDGRAYGEEWAAERAEPDELQKVEEMFVHWEGGEWEKLEEESRKPNGDTIMNCVLRELGHQRLDHACFSKQYIWYKNPNSLSLVRGFWEGALDFWREIKDEV